MTRASGGPLRIASLAKQVPVAASFRLEEGRLVRRGVEVEMNAYCRRAVAEGVTLARATQGTCTAVTLGPPGAEDVLSAVRIAPPPASRCRLPPWRPCLEPAPDLHSPGSAVAVSGWIPIEIQFIIVSTHFCKTNPIFVSIFNVNDKLPS